MSTLSSSSWWPQSAVDWSSSPAGNLIGGSQPVAGEAQGIVPNLEGVVPGASSGDLTADNSVGSSDDQCAVWSIWPLCQQQQLVRSRPAISLSSFALPLVIAISFLFLCLLVISCKLWIRAIVADMTRRRAAREEQRTLDVVRRRFAPSNARHSYGGVGGGHRRQRDDQSTYYSYDQFYPPPDNPYYPTNPDGTNSITTASAAAVPHASAPPSPYSAAFSSPSSFEYAKHVELPPSYDEAIR